MNNEKLNFNDEINALLEKFSVSRQKKLENFEELKKNLTAKLDREIARLYAKKDYITDMWSRRGELKLQRNSVIKNLMSNSLFMNIKYLISLPFIYVMIAPVVIMHFMLEIYHNICFRLYDIPLVKARDYFIFDRSMLPYLNYWERFNCLYCSYFNCLVSYMKEIGGRTERYWCPIKHAKRLKDQHSNYDKFVEYDEGDVFREKFEEIRKFDDVEPGK